MKTFADVFKKFPSDYGPTKFLIEDSGKIKETLNMITKFRTSGEKATIVFKYIEVRLEFA